MHEYSIVRGIVDIAEKETANQNGTVVESIELEIGELSGVEMSALNFIWEVAVKDSVLEHSEKDIIRTKGKARCMECQTEFSTTDHFNNCPSCDSFATGIIGGKELKVISITIH